MITQSLNLLLLTCSSLLILVHFLQNSDANQISPYCSPSACGIIRNISFPFRLKGDPQHCGDPSYELACENNITSIYLNSQKYHVKAINYHNLTIRLVDVSINNNSCSFPKYSLYRGTVYSPYTTYDDSGYSHYMYSEGFPEVAWPINFMSCQDPLENSSLLTETTTDCVSGDNFFDASNPSKGRHTYIKVGHMNASDVKDMCRVDLIVMTSWKFKDLKNVSVSEIHDSLQYGFELFWFIYRCSMCKRRYCIVGEGYSVDCYQGLPDKIYLTWKEIRLKLTGEGYARSYVVPIPILLLLIIVVLFAGLSLGFAAKIIIGLIPCVWGLLIFRKVVWSNDTVRGILENYWLVIGFSFAARFIILFPCVMWFLIYKFRRRHLSMFDAIEGFLQSDNKLMPIRYSYSDIKTMTRGFREKLGEGGFGSVYKGKLRSGHDVAVKLLGKPSANGQDFINEIATIGRIHHVNVVKLVGYCAEGSKRALVFDFMPNGSLEKHIFSREKMISLNWDRKYEIAVGVARGIEYLHRGCDIQILHFDIKPHNILLDDKFIPKISDFGLAKLCSTEKNTVTLTAARGTIGYVAPELINRSFGGVSYKADVYSFGMLLMEMVGLNRDLMGNDDNSSQYFPYWIYDCFNQGNDIEIGNADENDDDGNDSTRKIARKMTIVALWCIQMSPSDRPSMNKVLEMLEGEVERLQIPHRPSHSPQVAVFEDQSWSTCSTDSVSLLSHNAAPSVEITVEDL